MNPRIEAANRNTLMHELLVDVNGHGIEPLPDGYCILVKGRTFLLRESDGAFEQVCQYRHGCSNDGIIFDARIRAGLIKPYFG